MIIAGNKNYGVAEGLSKSWKVRFFDITIHNKDKIIVNIFTSLNITI